jgi:Ca2+-binding EF-hand superfamily protein
VRADDAWVLCGVAVTGFGGQLAITQAFRHGEASAIAPFEYSALAWGLAIDWLVWRTLPDGWMLAGAAIIVASGVYLVRHEAVHAEAEHPRRQRRLPGAPRGGARGSRASLNGIVFLNASTADAASRSGCHEPKERTMKKLPILLAGVLVSAAAIAQTATPERGEGMQRRMDFAEKMFGEADSNHDGAVSQSEWQAARLREANERFQKMDMNRDGKLTREEMQQAREHRQERMGEHRHGEWRERMRKMDKDGDGQLSRAEIGNDMPRLSQNFDQLDSNRDGKLSRDEMRAGRKQERGESPQRY